MQRRFKEKSLLAFILTAALILVLSGCGSNNTNGNAGDTGTAASPAASPQTTSSQTAEAGKTITDTDGRQVTVPSQINKIADAWPAHNEVVTILGAGDKIVSTISTPKSVPWLYKVNPQMNNAVTAFTKSEVQMEEVLKNKPDIAFASTGSPLIQLLENAGIPTVTLNFTNFDEMKECFRLTGQILGDDASQRADSFIGYLDGKLKDITAVTSKIAESDKPKVLHIQSLSPLQVDGKDTMIQNWIEVAGGINAAQELSGNMKPVSLEQIISWNPDYIMIGSGLTDTDHIMDDPAWKTLNAVKNGHVYNNPSGAFLWDRYGAEAALQIQWAAKTLHPDLFPDLNMVQETVSFYKQFLNYDLTNDEAQLIIDSKPPAK
ncbi:ABC transporter substrate-binding protein [Paenibacillus sp. URB8-2]|uniref:ABC transporter substrate-binding protein n=1 Tax=Paenibacillus sp. URB8-2 TaxID=2741301 RepID=UPI0015BAA0AA|nr:ABC transporter substrate-binding protein [Paenibacillus sp. URB8-2]BCG57828.1 ABC transporter substrate-binding protein [Paenibacillus sp. URB8-2]